MKIICFTTTGNSLAAARRFGGEVMSAVRLLADGTTILSDDEAIGLVCPVYFGDIPGPVRELLGRILLHAPYLFAVLTCGSTPALAARRLQELMPFDYVASLLTVDNYFPMFNVEKQVKNVGKKRVEEHLAAIVADVEARAAWTERPTLFGRIAAWWMKLFPLSPKAYKRFSIDHDKCTRCGVCSIVCPIDNIVFEPYPEIADRCLTCGACRHNCPENAIRYRGEKSEYQYLNPQVALGDIADCNDRR
ncbi:MAG: EFR1 family ferrodoxin [Muribaculaceae bacterium]|nr:EFR1 family ferrodoxin [Muribaculaceae bacterium]